MSLLATLPRLTSIGDFSFAAEHEEVEWVCQLELLDRDVQIHRLQFLSLQFAPVVVEQLVFEVRLLVLMPAAVGLGPLLLSALLYGLE